MIIVPPAARRAAARGMNVLMSYATRHASYNHESGCQLPGCSEFQVGGRRGGPTSFAVIAVECPRRLTSSTLAGNDAATRDLADR